MTFRKQLGKLLKEYRKEKGWKQEEAAKRAGLYRQTISEIENGAFIGALSTLEKYVAITNVELKAERQEDEFPQLEDLDKLFGGDE